MSAAKTPARAGRRSPDWGELHRRLQDVRERTERGWHPGPEETRRILKARAEALAREPQRDRAPQDALEVIEFALAQERYAIESAHVREVYPLKELTPVPCTPPFVLGIVSVRGQILSVLDLRRFFELPEKGLTDLNKVLILSSEAMAFGILADAILGTRTVLPSDLQPSLPTLTGIREAYLRGVAADGTVVLDAAKLLADPKLVVHEQVQE